MEAGRLWRLIDVLSCVALYMTVGPCLILVNKAILDTYGFPYPMLVSGLGQASSAVGATIVVKVLEPKARAGICETRLVRTLAATPRLPRGTREARVIRTDAAAAAWMFRGDSKSWRQSGAAGGSLYRSRPRP